MSRLLGLLWNVNAVKGRRTDWRETAERRHQRRMHLQLNFHAISPYAFVMQRNFILIVFALLSDDQHGEWCMKRIYHQQQRHVWWWERIFVDWKDHIVHSVRRDVEENVHKSFISLLLLLPLCRISCTHGNLSYNFSVLPFTQVSSLIALHSTSSIAKHNSNFCHS